MIDQECMFVVFCLFRLGMLSPHSPTQRLSMANVSAPLGALYCLASGWLVAIDVMDESNGIRCVSVGTCITHCIVCTGMQTVQAYFTLALT